MFRRFRRLSAAPPARRSKNPELQTKNRSRHDVGSESLTSSYRRTETLSVFERRFVRYGQFFATFGATGGQHLATFGSGHALTESVFVDPLPTRRLVCSLHCHSYTILLIFRIFSHSLPYSLALYLPLALSRPLLGRPQFMLTVRDCKSTTKKSTAKIFHEKISPMREKARNVANFVHRCVPTARSAA